MGTVIGRIKAVNTYRHNIYTAILCLFVLDTVSELGTL